MNENGSRFEEALFTGALALPPGERQEFVLRACGGDAAVWPRIEALLAGHEQGEGALDAKLPALTELTRVLKSQAPAEPETLDQIDRYHLKRIIGEGGFGVVWLAEQREPVRRDVALKIIRPGMDTRDVVARFEVERQALALMDHPNIARVFDGGRTESGRPYFVMEFVSGIPITRYCDEQRLGTSGRLQLFLQVCHAVQHAHQKGIIHRDLKPSNILVTNQNSGAVPKVIDFGIAKATSGAITSATATTFTQLIGTPAYMSPEQMDFGRVDIDTRSDVYNLGVLLYELLTGQTPFDPRTWAKYSFDQVRAIIREQVPEKPSTRIGALEVSARETITQQRNMDFFKLRTTLRGDIDWIVMRCLEKDRARRYPTAISLVHDIERHLNHQTVSARPPTAAYIIQKTIRRNRMAFAAGSAIAASLGFAVVANTREARLASQARDQAETHKRVAEAETARSRKIAQVMKEMLRNVSEQVTRSRDTKLLRAIVDDMRDRLKSELQKDPATYADLTETLSTLYGVMGEHKVGEDLLREALAIYQRLHGNDDLNVARVQLEIARSLRRRLRLFEMREPLRRSFEIRRQLLGPEHIDTAESLSELGGAEVHFDATVGERMLREALAVQRKLLGDQNLAVARTLTHMGSAFRHSGATLPTDYVEAERLLRAAWEIHQRFPGTETMERVRVAAELGVSLLRQGRTSDAEPLFRQSIEECNELLGTDHPAKIEAIAGLSGILARDNRRREADELIQTNLALVRRNTTPQAVVLLIYARKNFDRGEGVLREAIAAARSEREADPVNLPMYLSMFAAILVEQRRFADAEGPAREAVDLFQRVEIPVLFKAISEIGRMSLAQSFIGQGRFQEAEPLLLRTHEVVSEQAEKYPLVANSSLFFAFGPLIQLYRKWNRPQEEEAWRERGLTSAQRLQDRGYTRMADALRAQL